MLLLVGLGNPGASYALNRHNIGFTAVQAIAKFHGLGNWRRRFQGITSEGVIAGVHSLLLLPGTYMNESGRAVAEAAFFYKISRTQIIVFHDDIDLPPAKVRVKMGGGIAGHNGLRSVSDAIGNVYRRVRIGVGRPRIKYLVEHYVLSDFGKSELEWVEPLMTIIAENSELLVRDHDASFQNKVHLAMAEQGFGEAEAGG
jgi:peptidyl-tRNA hydrolase, PTH1 family